MSCPDLELLLKKYGNAASKEELYIKNLLENIAKTLTICDTNEYYYADLVAQDFCRVIDMMEKQRKKESAILGTTAQRSSPFPNHFELVRAFYNHFKEEEQVDYWEIDHAIRNGRKDLVNLTLKDYVARIYTFSGKRYLGEMFRLEEITQSDPVLFTFENLEMILATFKTRDEEGAIVKQRVNLRSALRKLNEFKQYLTTR